MRLVVFGLAILVIPIGSALSMAAATMDAPLSQETRMWYQIGGTLITLVSGIVIGIVLSVEKRG